MIIANFPIFLRSKLNQNMSESIRKLCDSDMSTSGLAINQFPQFFCKKANFLQLWSTLRLYIAGNRRNCAILSSESSFSYIKTYFWTISMHFRFDQISKTRTNVIQAVNFGTGSNFQLLLLVNKFDFWSLFWVWICENMHSIGLLSFATG